MWLHIYVAVRAQLLAWDVCVCVCVCVLSLSLSPAVAYRLAKRASWDAPFCVFMLGPSTT